MTQLIRKPVVLQRCGISQSSLYRQIKEGTFPRPILISERCVAWVEHEVDAWMEAKRCNR